MLNKNQPVIRHRIFVKEHFRKTRSGRVYKVTPHYRYIDIVDDDADKKLRLWRHKLFR